jgi:hypothetical protein
MRRPPVALPVRGERSGMVKSSSHKFKWKIFAAGMISIVAGYLLLAAADITVSPILLVLGYCILIPLSFL